MSRNKGKKLCGLTHSFGFHPNLAIHTKLIAFKYPTFTELEPSLKRYG